jgi:hypothetical protein
MKSHIPIYAGYYLENIITGQKFYVRWVVRKYKGLIATGFMNNELTQTHLRIKASEFKAWYVIKELETEKHNLEKFL